MIKIINFIKSCIEDFKKVPSWLISLSAVTTILMNILANKTLFSDANLFSIDCGIIVSWVMFLIMDVATQKYGGKASFAITIFDILVSLVMSGLMFVVSIIPETSVSGWFQAEEVSVVLNNLIGNNYLIVVTSLFAFLCASVVDIALNITLAKLLNNVRIFKDENGKRTIKGLFIYIMRAYGSTFLSQFVDNLVFMVIAYPLLFNMSCSISSILMGAFLVSVAELIIEFIFAPIGFLSTTNKKE